jgi:hypothetical protein
VTFVALAGLSGAGVGCSGQSFPAPADFPEDGHALVAALDASRQQLSTARIRATLEYYGAGDRARVRQALVLRPPYDLRLETISPLDTTVSVFLLSEDELRYYDLAGESFIVGTPSVEHVSQLIPLELSGPDVVSVLTGGIPMDRVDVDAEWPVSWNRREGWYEVDLPTAAGGTLQVSIDPQPLSMRGAQYSGDSVVAPWELRMADFRNVAAESADADFIVPYRLRFLMRQERIDISLDLERFQYNPELPDTLFELTPPRGVEVRTMR